MWLISPQWDFPGSLRYLWPAWLAAAAGACEQHANICLRLCNHLGDGLIGLAAKRPKVRAA